MTTKHTPAPWRVGDAGMTVFGQKTDRPSPETIATCRRRENTARIVACVNACEGMTDPAAEIAALRAALAEAKTYLHSLRGIGEANEASENVLSTVRAALGA